MCFITCILLLSLITVLNAFIIKSDLKLRNPIYSRTSIETVIHTDDLEDYDVNSVQYRKAKYWRAKSIPELEEVRRFFNSLKTHLYIQEIRRVRKVLAKIEEYRRVKNPDLRPNSLRNAKRTLAQLLFLRHEHHLNTLRKQLKDENREEIK